jgi:hypothetical protein
MQEVRAPKENTPMLEELIARTVWAERETALHAAMIRYELLHGVGRLPAATRPQVARERGRRGWWARLTFARE